MICPYCKNPLNLTKYANLATQENPVIDEKDLEDIKNGNIVYYCSKSCPGWFFDKNINTVKLWHHTRFETIVICAAVNPDQIYQNYMKNAP